MTGAAKAAVGSALGALLLAGSTGVLYKKNQALQESLARQQELCGQWQSAHQAAQEDAAQLQASAAQMDERIAQLEGQLDASSKQAHETQQDYEKRLEKLRQDRANALAQQQQTLAELQHLIADQKVKISQLANGGILLSVDDKILFPSGEAQLTAAGLAVMDKVAAALRSTDMGVRVEGHTDNIPLSGRGRFRNNWELSAARATTVGAQLLAMPGLDPKRIEMVAMGEQHPVAANDTAEGRAQNRRIEIYLLPLPGKAGAEKLP